MRIDGRQEPSFVRRITGVGGQFERITYGEVGKPIIFIEQHECELDARENAGFSVKNEYSAQVIVLTVWICCLACCQKFCELGAFRSL